MKQIKSAACAVVVRADDTVDLVPCDTDKTLSLDKLHQLVNGYIEVIYASRFAPLVMILNEEGRLLNLPVNKAATAWQNDVYGNEINEPIVGDVVIMRADGDNLIGLNPKLAKQLGAAFSQRLQNKTISDFLKEHVECELTKVKRHAR